LSNLPAEHHLLATTRHRATATLVFRASVLFTAVAQRRLPQCRLRSHALRLCMPIVSDVNALPDIAAGCGIVVKQRNNEVLKVAIEKALQMSTTVMAQKASEHIRKEYTMQKRKDQLCELYYRLIQK
jgi:glycosyltransferase involved in cell wall biosynthesis